MYNQNTVSTVSSYLGLIDLRLIHVPPLWACPPWKPALPMPSTVGLRSHIDTSSRRPCLVSSRRPAMGPGL